LAALWRTALRWAALPGAAAAVLSALAVGAPWPTVQVLSLAIGLVAGLVAARTSGARPPYDLLFLATFAVGAGLAGSLADQPATLASLGACVVVAAVAGVVGRTATARSVAWAATVGTGGLLAGAAAAAAGAGLRWAAYWVLGAAAVGLAIAAGLALAARRATRADAMESRAAEAMAHATALVAVLLAGGSARHAAGILALWGLAIGGRALVPGTHLGGRRWRAAVGAGCELTGYWLMLAAGGVAVVEAYTVPLAITALLAGWLAARADPNLRSWVTYGPAMLAGLAPSLAVAVSGGTPLRRLLVGVAAVVVVLFGSAARQQAPVVVGGATVVIIALHEVTQWWDLIPRWVPLGIAGLVLVAVASTYERRRRDVLRLRGAVGRMR
jgi:hypothetical protein